MSNFQFFVSCHFWHCFQAIIISLLFQTLAMLLSTIPLTARGPSQIMVFDIHALQERFYFTDRVIPR